PLEAVAAYESRLTILQVAEPRNVKPAGPTVVERGRLADEVLHEPGDSGAHPVLAGVVTHVPARVADAIGMLRRASQQQQARRFEGGRGHDHDLGVGFVRLPRNAGEKPNSGRLSGQRVADT